MDTNTCNAREALVAHESRAQPASWPVELQAVGFNDAAAVIGYMDDIDAEVARITGDEGEDSSLQVLRRMPDYQPAQPASVAEAEDARLFRALVCRFGPERNQTTEGRPHDILLQLRIEPSEEVYRPDGSLDFEASIRNVLEAECAIQAAAPQPPAKDGE